MATVSFHNIQKQFGEVKVIHGIDMEIEDGEFVVIVGPSGCGKSTLLRMVAGLETISNGELLIDGGRANEKEPMDRDIAMVFQNYALYPHMTVASNMGYGLKIRGMSKSAIEEKVNAAAKLLQLEALLDRKPRELSGGQRQRVAMGRAIVREPAVFLFDEPLSNLDAKLRVQMRLEIRELQSKLGITALYVTHDQVEAMTMADRLVVMNEGVAEQVGRPLDLYQDPDSLFVAGFIGSPSMNTLSGPAAALADQLRPLGIESLPAPPGGDLSVGIRPEHFELTDSPGASGFAPFEVELVEPLGSDSLLHGFIEGIDANVVVRVAGAFTGGGKVGVKPDRDQVMFFDTRSGKCLRA